MIAWKESVLPDDRDVVPVERRHDRDVIGGLVEHLTRDPGTGGMRHRVVHVQQVEPMGAHDFVHPHRQREVVRRVLEERIATDVDFMEVDARQEDGRRNGCWYVMKWISWPRLASAMPSSVAMAPEPPYVG